MWAKFEQNPGQFEVKFLEFDVIAGRDGNVVRTVVRAAATSREVTNKIYIAFPRCRILSVKVYEPYF